MVKLAYEILKTRVHGCESHVQQHTSRLDQLAERADVLNDEQSKMRDCLADILLELSSLSESFFEHDRNSRVTLDIELRKATLCTTGDDRIRESWDLSQVRVLFS